jgi:hypothetical protein
MSFDFSQQLLVQKFVHDIKCRSYYDLKLLFETSLNTMNIEWNTKINLQLCSVISVVS